MNYLRRAIILAAVAATLSCASIVNAQSSCASTARPARYGRQPLTADLAFSTRVSAQITSELDKAQRREAEDIIELIKSEQDAREELSKTRKAKEKALAELLKRKGEEQTAARALDNILSGANAGGRSVREARRELNKARAERVKAQRAAETLARAEQKANERLLQEKTRRERAQQVYIVRSNRRELQKRRLANFEAQWLNDSTDENLTALTDQITAISCEQEIYAVPTWKTNPSPGATIYYQSKGERRRRQAPHAINNPTETKQPICLGRYFIWAVRFDANSKQNKPTSDINKPFDIYKGTSEIIVVEYQQHPED